MASAKHAFSVIGHQQKLDTSMPTDFCIKLKEGSIPVHKEVLTSASHYFHCLFESDMKEVKNQTLILHDLDLHAVETVVDYMYGNDIRIEWDDVVDYLDIVESWQITELKDMLEIYVAMNIDVDNCISWSFIAQRYCMKKVQERRDELMHSDFASVTASSDFLSLDFSALRDFLTEDMTTNLSCDDKLRACINWILVNETERETHYKDLLNHTGLLKCSHRFIELVVRSYIKTLSEKDCQSATPYTSKLLAWTCVPKVNQRKTMVALGDKPNKLDPNKNILQFDFEKETIEEIGSLPDIFVGTYPARCSTPYGMFSGGARVEAFMRSAICAILDIPSMAYLCLPDLYVPLKITGAVFVNDKVYVDGCIEQNHMHRLDLQTFQWSPCTRLSPSAYCPPLCNIGDTIYTISRLLPFSLMAYSTVNDAWSVEEGLPFKHSHKVVAGAVPDGLNIYAIATSKEEGSGCMRYDTYLKKWTEHAEFPSRSDSCTAACVDKNIVVCGTTPRIDVYDIQRNEWEESSLKMPQGLQNIFTITL